MNNFYLGNYCSINLNFVMYIYNLYKNLNNSRDIFNKFPYMSLDENALLEYSLLEIKSQELWGRIFNTENLREDDMNFWMNKKFSFNQLFYEDIAGSKTYEEVKKSFEAWYWGTGRQLCSLATNHYVDSYYKELINMAKMKNKNLKDTLFALQVVYDMPPTSWEFKNNQMILISPAAKLPNVEELFNICVGSYS